MYAVGTTKSTNSKLQFFFEPGRMYVKNINGKKNSKNNAKMFSIYGNQTRTKKYNNY